MAIVDTFSGAGALASHLPDVNPTGAGYFSATTGLTITLNAIHATGNFQVAKIEGGGHDSEFIIDFYPGGADNRYITWSRGSGTIASANGYEGVIQTSLNTIKIVKSVLGGETTLATGTFTFTNVLTYNLRMVVVGATQAFYIDNVLQLTATDASVTTGTQGWIYWGQWANSAGAASNFRYLCGLPLGSTSMMGVGN